MDFQGIKEEPIGAWNENENDEDTEKNQEEMKETKTGFDLFKEYTEYSTIQGLIYIFFDNQTLIGRIFWSLVLLFLVCLGLYWTIDSYQDWQNNPVLTTVATTAYAVNQVDFPTVTFCGSGFDMNTFMSAGLKQFFDYLDAINSSISMTPLEGARLTLMIYNGTWAPEDVAKGWMLYSKMFSPQYLSYITEYFPGMGLVEDLRWIIPLLAKDPDMSIAAIVAMDRKISICINSTVVQCNDTASVLDVANRLCYQTSNVLYDKHNATLLCNNEELLQFDSDAQVHGFLALLSSGNITLPDKSNGTFYLDGIKNSNGNFIFANNMSVNSFQTLVLQQGDTNLDCLSAQYVPGSSTLKIKLTDCKSEHATICRLMPKITTTCSPKVPSILEFLLDPMFSEKKNEALDARKTSYQSTYSNINKTAIFKTLFKYLWYATLPCSDLREITSNREGEKSLLRYCEWKGKPISCAAIFTSFPTDRGICCSFNMKAAEELFQGTTYPNLITELQNQDRNLSFLNTTPPEYYVANQEPKSQPGTNKGLVVMLDAHSDLLYAASADTNLKGFSGLISQKGSFPFTMYESFDIRPGHVNLVALSGSKVDADDSLRSLDREDRNCMFADENDKLKLHRSYSYTNCIFECSLFYARNKMQQIQNSSTSCTPWYFPSNEQFITMCDPWEATEFLDLMSVIPEGTCSHCLPDCSYTIYDTSVTAIPFQRCGISNFGVSSMCSLHNTMMPQPRRYGAQVLSEFQSPYPAYLNTIISSTRYYNDLGLFQNQKAYDAYDEDMAMVQIYFKKATIVQLQSQAQMTWIGFFSNVGGLLGLVLGMGIVSIIELFWLCLRIISNKYDLTKWIN